MAILHTTTQWLIRLKLLRMKASRTESGKSRLHSEIENLLAGLVALDPARAAMLRG